MALFPDGVNFQYVPGPRVKVSFHDPADFLSALRSRDHSRMQQLESVETDIIDLEIITESPPWVMAGISEKYRSVFIYEEESDYREYE